MTAEMAATSTGTSPTLTANWLRSAGYTLTVSRTGTCLSSKAVWRVSMTETRPSLGSLKKDVSISSGAASRTLTAVGGALGGLARVLMVGVLSVFTDDPEIAETVRSLRVHGKGKD